ncbi:Cleavage and polyadenylation specificity factor 73, partial [Orchesella cincta]
MASSTGSGGAPAEESDQLVIRPLGAGQEVGRSCIMLEFKGKKIMLDIGIHPGHTGMEALPFVDLIDADEVDLLLVSHFHLDHAGALPWFLLKTAVNISTDHILYTEADLEASMDKIETINFHEEKEIKGVKFWAYHAGHVLGAAMFMIEIAGVKILYTGDFSRQEDRHLMAAEVPSMRPDVMIVVSFFFGIWFETRNDELKNVLLVLGVDVWNAHPREAGGQGDPVHEHSARYSWERWSLPDPLHVRVPNIRELHEREDQEIVVSNPFVFKHISNLKSIDHFDLASSPGMMQSGLSRELFEMWCTDPKNGVIIAGYVVEGTLLSGASVVPKMSVDYISFSAHTDHEFIRTLRAPYIVLVHGEQNEMGG